MLPLHGDTNIHTLANWCYFFGRKDRADLQVDISSIPSGEQGPHPYIVNHSIDTPYSILETSMKVIVATATPGIMLSGSRAMSPNQPARRLRPVSFPTKAGGFPASLAKCRLGEPGKRSACTKRLKDREAIFMPHRGELSAFMQALQGR